MKVNTGCAKEYTGHGFISIENTETPHNLSPYDSVYTLINSLIIPVKHCRLERLEVKYWKLKNVVSAVLADGLINSS